MLVDGCKECGQSKKAAYDRDNAKFRVKQLETELERLDKALALEREQHACTIDVLEQTRRERDVLIQGVSNGTG